MQEIRQEVRSPPSEPVQLTLLSSECGIKTKVRTRIQSLSGSEKVEELRTRCHVNKRLERLREVLKVMWCSSMLHNSTLITLIHLIVHFD